MVWWIDTPTFMRVSEATSADFKLYTTEGILEDWPISYEELLPYYELDVSITGFVVYLKSILSCI